MSHKLNISFDVSQITDQFSLNKSQTKDLIVSVLKDISSVVIHEWRTEASKVLKGTKEEYLQGIQRPIISQNVSTIELIGTLPNMIENGASPFDMKVGFKRSSKAKNKKDGGWFITIAFRHGTPGTTGSNFQVMPDEVYGVMRTRKDGEPLKTSELPKNLQKPGMRKEIRTENKVYGIYHHKTNIFEGMQKKQKVYGSGTTQSKYITFRRISDTSDPDSWIHKGLVRRNFADKALSNIDVPVIVSNSVDEFLKESGL